MHFNSVLSMRTTAAGVLFNSVRSQAGLAYTVSANWDAPATHPGLFLAYAETGKPAETIEAMQRVFKDVLEQPFSEERVDRKKQERLNSFVFTYSSKAAQLQRKVLYDLVGLPKDYLQQYQEGIQRVTAGDVLAAARRHLHPADQTIVVVADAEKARPGLQRLGLPIVPVEL